MSYGVSYLPFLVVGLVTTTTIATFYLSISSKHVTYMWPYISDTGTFPPESCIFGQSLNVVSALIAFAIYIKFLQVNEIYQKHHIEEKFHLNRVTLFMGLTASLGLNLVANFQETNAFAFHWFAAILTFGGGSFYLCLQTLLYVKISPVIGQRKTTMFRMVLSCVACLSFVAMTISAFLAYGQFKGEDVTKWKMEDGGFHVHQISTNSEWICAGCIMVYISLFYDEFKRISVSSLSIAFDEPKHEN